MDLCHLHNVMQMLSLRDVLLSRRLALRSGLAMASAVCVPGCGWLQDKPMSVAAHLWVGYEPMFLAQQRGWLDSSKVTLVQTPNANASLAALHRGEVNAVALTLDELITARAGGQNLTAVLVFNVSMGADVVLGRSDFTGLHQLKGATLGLEDSSVASMMLVELLKAANLTASDVKLVKIPIEAHLQAWQSRQVDALITYEPKATQLMTQGMVRLFDSRQMPISIVDVLAVTPEVLNQAHASALSQLLAAHFKALDALTSNPQDTAYRMANHLGLPASDVLTAFKGLMLPTPAINYRMLAGAAPELLPIAQRVSDTLQRSGVLTQPPDLNGLVDASRLPTNGLLK